MAEPVNPDPTRRWIQQQRRSLPPRTSPPSSHQPPTMPAPAAYQQRPPQLQRSIYQQGTQYPPRPQPRQVAYSQHAPYQQPLHYPPVLQYPPVATPYPPAASYPPAAPYGHHPARRRKSTRSTAALLIGGGVVAVALAVALGLGSAKLMSSTGNQLDVREVETGVKQILSDSGYGYGIDHVQAISCNDGANPSVERGAGFTCDVIVDGTRRRVAVVFVDDQGTYEVDRPR